MKRYKNLITGKVRTLTDEQIRRLKKFNRVENGRAYENYGWVALPDEPKNEKAKSIVQESTEPKQTRIKRNGNSDK